MSAGKRAAIAAFDSAYPGSMFEREDGGYLLRDDAPSLAAGLLALIASGDRAAEDLGYALDAMREQRDELARELKHAAQWFDQLTPADVERYRAALSKATGLPQP